MRIALAILVSLLALVVGCQVTPEYRRPAVLATNSVPTHFTGDSATTNGVIWKVAEPGAHLPRNGWWEIFHDATLNRLETMATNANQDLAAGLARIEQARALLQTARAGSMPQISAGASGIRQGTSQNAPQNGRPAGARHEYSTMNAGVGLSWELDLWGRVRAQSEAARARMTATVDDFESGKLAVAAEVATTYFTIGALDIELLSLKDSVETYKRSLELTRNRRQEGIASDLDVSLAETQLRTTEAQIPVVRLQRISALNALAVLCGRPATGFEVAPKLNGTEGLPMIPVTLPSDLLERRPDIAAAERRMAAANADAGVAKASFYPRFMFSGLAGLQSVDIGTWFDWPSRLWSVGPSLEVPLFTGKRLKSQLAFARAAYQETTARYRQTVLRAFQEMETQMATVQLKHAQLDAETAALTSARRTLAVADNRYRAGLVTYLEVATAQAAVLARERTLDQLLGDCRIATVNLIKAAGGGWDMGEKQPLPPQPSPIPHN